MEKQYPLLIGCQKHFGPKKFCMKYGLIDMKDYIVCLACSLYCTRMKIKVKISIVIPTRRTIFEIIEYHSTCFGRSFRPSSGVQDCRHSIRYMSYRLVDCLLAGTRWNWNQFHLMPASKQSTDLYDIYLMLCVQS